MRCAAATGAPRGAKGGVVVRRWALLVVALYAILLVGWTAPALLIAFAEFPVPRLQVPESAGPFGEWPYWVGVAVMAAGQAALLVVPVRVAVGRPVSRRSLLWPIVASGFTMALLVGGAVCALREFLASSVELRGAFLHAGIGLLVAVWIGWSVVFHRATRHTEPGDLVSRICRTLYRGSILELLVAVPTHVVARCRDYCCAGFLTFVGIATGISVMLFSFGPAVFVLYAARWRRLHPQPGAAPPDAPPRRA